MSDLQSAKAWTAELEAAFIQSRKEGLAAVNPNTFWSVALILLSFSAWDYFVDPARWRVAFGIRLVAVLVIIATGLFQKLPGKLTWLPLLAKISDVRFRNPVFPGETVTIEVKKKEVLGGFTMMSGNIKSGDKRVLTVEFAVAWKVPGATP